MKQLKLYLLLIACCSSCIEENTYINDCDEPKTVIGKQELNNELSQEAADEAYKSLLSIIEQKTRSGSNEIEKWYGGAYINDRGELVVKSTDLNLSSNLDIPNTVIEKCDYSLRNLENIRKKIEDLFYKDDHFVLNHIILFGINPMTNSFEVGLDDVSKENVSYFIDNISSCPAVRFVECKRPEFTSKELICAEMVSNLSNIVITETGKDSIFSASIGYRARKKDNGDIGVVTAGHFISKGQFLGRISNDAKDTIGICIDSRNMDGVLDAAFCKITNNNFYPSNKIDFMINPDVDTLSIELATPAVGRTINMVGCMSARKSGKVYLDSTNIIIKDGNYNKKILTDAMLLTCVPKVGDSGGIVYALNEINNVRYTVGIISGFIKYTYSTQVQPKLYGICCKAEVINRLYGIERY